MASPHTEKKHFYRKTEIYSKYPIGFGIYRKFRALILAESIGKSAPHIRICQPISQPNMKILLKIATETAAWENTPNLHLVDGLIFQSKRNPIDKTLFHTPEQIASYTNACELMESDILVPLQSYHPEHTISEAEMLSELSNHIVVRIPFSTIGLKTTADLASKNIPVNCTGIKNLTHAIIAAKSGAKYISVSMQDIKNITIDPMEFLRDITETFDNYDFGSILTIEHITEKNESAHCARYGIGAISMSIDTLKTISLAV